VDDFHDKSPKASFCNIESTNVFHDKTLRRKYEYYFLSLSFAMFSCRYI
jgi:hypothetical protein